ncbi:MAG: PepSY domain-containing protein [Parvularculaceae bacterium]|nr:PepSY domain-containing protein [Parvularculaceae bacterium]
MPAFLSRRASQRVVAAVHFWLSLVVGLQMLLWTASGLFMALAPIETVRSEHRLAEKAAVDLAALGPYATPSAAFAAARGPATRLALEIVGGSPAYVVEHADGGSVLIDARTDAVLSPINEGLAQRIAEEAIAGDAPSLRAVWIDADPPIEFREPLPVWRVDFAEEKLSVYVSPQTGRILARRSDLWRTYDFLWALHIMDYQGRENFNHPLLIVVAALSLVMSIAGLILLALRLPERMKEKPRLAP